MSLNNSQKRFVDCANYSWDTFVQDRVQDLWVFTPQSLKGRMATAYLGSLSACAGGETVVFGCMHSTFDYMKSTDANRDGRRWQQLHMVLASCSHRAACPLSITHGTHYKRWYQRLESIVILCAFTEDGSQVVQTLFQICIHIRRTLLYRPPFLAT